jgi:hypothetical protein
MDSEPTPQPWLALRFKGRFKENAFEPTVKETEIDALR